MIDVIIIANLLAAPVTFALLGFVLALYIFGAEPSANGNLFGSTAMSIGANVIGVAPLPLLLRWTVSVFMSRPTTTAYRSGLYLIFRIAAPSSSPKLLIIQKVFAVALLVIAMPFALLLWMFLIILSLMLKNLVAVFGVRLFVCAALAISTTKLKAIFGSSIDLKAKMWQVFAAVRATLQEKWKIDHDVFLPSHSILLSAGGGIDRRFGLQSLADFISISHFQVGD